MQKLPPQLEPHKLKQVLPIDSVFIYSPMNFNRQVTRSLSITEYGMFYDSIETWITLWFPLETAVSFHILIHCHKWSFLNLLPLFPAGHRSGSTCLFCHQWSFSVRWCKRLFIYWCRYWNTCSCHTYYEMTPFDEMMSLSKSIFRIWMGARQYRQRRGLSL